ncbi:MAG TPA: hypothetical protein V6D15_16120 [Oculatellaceae cyanobacterium]
MFKKHGQVLVNHLFTFGQPLVNRLFTIGQPFVYLGSTTCLPLVNHWLSRYTNG